MTIDDDNSVYVGGLPYNATEETLRRAFDFYGHVVAVKIINDHGTRGKCYGFVTFTNPRSAIDAINDMNGRTIGGRVVRVNGVTTRGGRLNSGQDRFRHNAKRAADGDKGRNRLRDYDRDRDRYEDRYSDRSRERSRSQVHYEDVEREYEDELDHDQGRDHILDRLQDRDRLGKVNGSEYSRDSGRDWDHDLDHDQDREMDVAGASGPHQSVDKDKDQLSRKLNGSETNDRQSRELSSNSRDEHNGRGKTQIERSVHRREELRKEISEMEESLKEKQQLILDLQRESKKLEDALIDAKKHSSRQQMHLTKLCKCFLQVREYTEKLKSSEKELQALVDTVMTECDVADGKDAILANGNA